MKTSHSPRHLLVVILLFLALSLTALVSCLAPSQSSSFYDAGAGNLTVTGSQFAQYFLYRFDTSSSGRFFTLPNAADIVSAISSPFVGEVLIFGVTADGANTVTLVGGTNVTIKPSALTVAPNTTLTIYCVLNNVASGNQAVAVY
jgi:hypothetical protein